MFDGRRDVRFSFLKGMAGALPSYGLTDGQKRDGNNRGWKHQRDKDKCYLMTFRHAVLTPSKSVVALWDIHSSLLH